MLILNKNQAIFQLEQVLNKVKDCRYKSLTKFTPYFTEAERDALQYAINFMKNENNDADNIYKIKQDYDKKLKEEIQERCDHELIRKTWVDACFYECTCRKCGKVEEFYERD